jgi:DNA-binding response OmpR family regulator
MPELNAKILIVYGDETIRVSLATSMEREGFRTLQASNEKAGLGVVRTASPDLMLVGIKEGDLNGIDVLREARDLNPNLLIIAITAYRDIHGAAKALDAGADSYLEKPVPVREVTRVVRQALLNKKLESQVKTQQAQRCLPQRKNHLGRAL